ncbi:ATP-binding protein [Actinoplanes sp. NPDC051475]|uniref:ATP-binding protein n=1 Tax=Actinoplanes sp. NPDC051475 TaxID=3157225 RepID=UPI003450A661
MTATSIPPCWSNAEIQVAAQVDVGGLEFGDPPADAVFNAVHQTVPLARLAKGGVREPVTEREVLADLCQPLVSNEPLIRFITGIVGRGKSHFVRWLRVHTPPRNDWHIVYIEKRNTSLRRIIEQVIEGIDAPSAASLRASLASAASRVTTVPEAMLALLNHLHRLVEFDDAPLIQNLSGADLADIRGLVARLVGDYTFKQQLSRPGGPIERIAKLAKDGHQPGSDVNAEDLHLSEADLRVDPEEFLDAGVDIQRKIRDFAANRSLRAAAAAVLDYYLPRATAEVFTGTSTDLLQVFEDVRGELARRHQQLVLFVEDLVLLHGIEAQLAQALTIPARRDLCRIRAVIAVTTGYLDDRYATFAERGVHYTMDVDRAAVDIGDLRSFVGRYLNAGRVGRHKLAAAANAGARTPNQCTDCVYRDRCHPAFGVTREGHGLFPFNAAAVDHLVALASPRSFDPRNILRTVIREPLAVAEAELSTPGLFPSARFGASLAPTRMSVPVELRDAIARQSNSAQAEISLRAFYATNPPAADEGLQPIAEMFGVALTELADDHSSAPPIAEPTPTGPAPASEIDKWVAGGRLAAPTAQKIRRWILDALAARLLTGPHGLSVKRAASNILVGPVTIKPGHVVVENAGGGGSTPPDSLTIEFRSNDRDGVLLKGVLAATSGDLLGPNGGRWFFEIQQRLTKLEAEVVEVAGQSAKPDVASALAVLGVLSSVDGRRPNSPASALAVMIRPKRPAGTNPKIVRFLDAVEPYRIKALTVIRDSLTQRKGYGASSIFDAGAVLPFLVPSVQETELRADLRNYASLHLNLRGFHDKQLSAAQDMWAPVRDLVVKINGFVAEEEDLAATVAIMDSFATQAHRGSALTRQDAKEAYDRLRPGITSERLSELRGLTRACRSTPDASTLWELAFDPVLMLTDMLQYWRLCDQLLRSLRNPAESTSGLPDSYNRARLQKALRDLANTLEGLAKR